MYLIICVLIYALLTESNSMKMIKIDRNMSKLWHCVYKYNFDISAFVEVIVRNKKNRYDSWGLRTYHYTNVIETFFVEIVINVQNDHP